MRRRALRILLFWSPLLCWLGFAAVIATALGSYGESWTLLHWLFDTIEPGFYYADHQIISMYQVTQATRKLAHVVVYSGITLATIRACQRGRPRLQKSSVVIAVLLSVAFMGIETFIRLNYSEGTRHVRPQQFVLNTIGVGIVLVGTLAFFGIKSLEQRLLLEDNEDHATHSHDSTTDDPDRHHPDTGTADEADSTAGNDPR